jgi:hypothetical protein
MVNLKTSGNAKPGITTNSKQKIDNKISSTVVKQNIKTVDSAKKVSSINSKGSKTGISKIATTGISDINFGDLINTGKDIVKNVVDIVENPVGGLLEVPKTALKVFDSTNKVVDALNTGQTSAKVTQLKDDIVKKVAESTLVVSTTNIPSSFSNQTNFPDIKETRTIDPDDGEEIITISGTYLVAVLANGGDGLVREFTLRIVPSDGLTLGERVQQLALIEQKWRLVKGTLIWVNGQGSNTDNTVGNIVLSSIKGVINNPSPSIHGITERGKATVTCAVNQNGQVDVPGFNGQWFQTVNSTSVRDMGFYTDAIIEAYSFNTVTTTEPIPLGSVLFSFVVQFKFPMEYNGFGKSMGLPDMMGTMVFLIRNAYMQCQLNIPFKAYVKTFLKLLQKLAEYDSIKKDKALKDITFEGIIPGLKYVKKIPSLLGNCNGGTKKYLTKGKNKRVVELFDNKFSPFPDSYIDKTLMADLDFYQDSSAVQDKIFEFFFKERLIEVFGDLTKQYLYFRDRFLVFYYHILIIIDGTDLVQYKINSIAATLLETYIQYLEVLEDPSKFIDKIEDESYGLLEK